jgi:hypothetical protein
MCITGRNRDTYIVSRSATGANALEAVVRRWRVTSWGIRKAFVGIRDPLLRAEIQRLLDARVMGKAHEATPLPAERSEALAALCEALLRQFDDEQAGAAEIRLVVHKQGELPTESATVPPPDSTSDHDEEENELVWELRQLLASSGGTIADVANVLERRGHDVDRKGRELLQDEVRAVEVDIAVLKTLLSDAVDWDAECRRLLADEVPPFEDLFVDDEHDEPDLL